MKLLSLEMLRDKLKAKRSKLKRSLSQKELAEVIGVSPRTIQKALHPEREKSGLGLQSYMKILEWAK